MSKSIAAPERLNAADRRHRAVELRKLGFTYQKIADQLGISRQAAHRLVVTALQDLREKTAESTEELRTLELERLDEYQLRVAQEITAGRALGAIDRGLRIMERRSRLLGLAVPTKVSISAADEEIVQILSTQLNSPDEVWANRAADALKLIVDGVAPSVAVLGLVSELKMAGGR